MKLTTKILLVTLVLVMLSGATAGAAELAPHPSLDQVDCARGSCADPPPAEPSRRQAAPETQDPPRIILFILRLPGFLAAETRQADRPSIRRWFEGWPD